MLKPARNTTYYTKGTKLILNLVPYRYINYVFLF
jgi:hypothetical protein